jgi:hypothetical protein
MIRKAMIATITCPSSEWINKHFSEAQARLILATTKIIMHKTFDSKELLGNIDDVVFIVSKLERNSGL